MPLVRELLLVTCTGPSLPCACLLLWICRPCWFRLRGAVLDQSINFPAARVTAPQVQLGGCTDSDVRIDRSGRQSAVVLGCGGVLGIAHTPVPQRQLEQAFGRHNRAVISPTFSRVWDLWVDEDYSPLRVGIQGPSRARAGRVHQRHGLVARPRGQYCPPLVSNHESARSSASCASECGASVGCQQHQW